MRLFVVLAGLLLIALAAVWFFTDVSTELRQLLIDFGILEPPPRSLTSSGSWDTVKMGLDAVNAIVGCIGLYLTLRAARRPTAT